VHWLSWLGAAVVGLFGAVLVGSLRTVSMRSGGFVVVLLFTLVLLGWVVLPIVLPGIADQSLDPDMLAIYPLTARQQVAGLLLGALVSPAALFTLLLAAGGAGAADLSPGARLVALVAAIAFAIMCVAGSCATQALLSRAEQSRRGGDVAVIAAGVAVVSLYLVRQTFGHVTAHLQSLSGGPMQTTLSWLPPGAAAQISSDLRTPDWLTATVRLLVVVLVDLLLVEAWAWAIRRRVNGGCSSEARATSRPATASPLLVVPWSARGGPMAAVASQQLRYYFFRSPQAVKVVAITPVVAALVGHSLTTQAGLFVGSQFFAAAAAGALSINVLGFDRGAFPFYPQVGAPMGAVLKGKLLAAATPAIPLVLLYPVVEAAVSRNWGSYQSAAWASAAVGTAAVGFGALTSVWFPNNVDAKRGSHASVTIRANALLFGSLTALAIVLTRAHDHLPATAPVLGAAGLCCAFLATVTLIRFATRWLIRDPWRVLTALAR
jgi:ABC-2 type transport system permease protein